MGFQTVAHQGFHAGRTGRPLESNPYPRGSGAWWDWRNAWEGAQSPLAQCKYGEVVWPEVAE